MEILPDIIFEDEEMIALNKPSGMLSIEDGYHKELPNLKNILKKSYKSIFTVHRLDRFTSGVILFAKNAYSHKKLNSLFQNRIIKKKYLALTYGFPLWASNKLQIPLLKNGDRMHRTVYNSEKGQFSETHIAVIDKNDIFSLICASPRTGYTHQIRAHLSMIGLPIIGDRLYTRVYEIKSRKKLVEYPENCIFLHAWQLEIQHPVRNVILTLQAPLPPLFVEKINTLSLKFSIVK